MDNREEGKKDEQSCPALGIIRDPLVCFYFPNQHNYCHHVKKPEPIKLEHQEAFCLTENHNECVVFKQERAKHLPNDILGKAPSPIRVPKPRNLLVIIPSLMIFAAILALILLNSGGLLEQTPSNIQLNKSTIQLPNEPAASLTPNKINLLFLLPQKKDPTALPATLETSSQLTPTTGPGFSTPIGISRKYVIHQVKSGESLHYLAGLYNAHVSTISEINSLADGIPIQENQIVIVQPGANLDNYIQKLTAILIKQDTPLKTIAEDYSTTRAELIDLNELGNADFIPAGRWLIVPAQ